MMVITCWLCLAQVPGMEQLVREIMRIVKRGGIEKVLKKYETRASAKQGEIGSTRTFS